jgi:integrase/recombinase XerD
MTLSTTWEVAKSILGIGLSNMVNLPLKYVVKDVDRHGNRRFYVRRRGNGLKAVKIRLPGEPGSKEFMDAYGAALTNSSSQKIRKPEAGSFGFVCQKYYSSATFSVLSKSTKTWRRRVLDEICNDHGDKPISLMKSKHILDLRDDKKDMPGASFVRLKALKALFSFAVEQRLTSDDPTRGVKPLHIRRANIPVGA